MSERNLDFDRIIDRKNTDSLKFDFMKRRGYPEDVLSLWVADMDFKTSSYIEDALIDRVRHGIFGYTETGVEYFNAVHNWIYKHQGWDTKIEWLVKTPGVVTSLALAVKAYTNVGDKVLIQQPVYYPFTEVIEDNDRIRIVNNLYLGEDQRYHIDFDDFEVKIIENDVKLFIMCNPHNPVGRVWTEQELTKMGEICLKHNVIVVVDEIHQDFVFKGKHTVFANINKEFEQISITCTSASKTFNLASMLISNIFIPNTKLRHKFKKEYAACGLSQLSALGIVATQTAYTLGEEWYNEVYKYIYSNIEYTRKYIEEYIPTVHMIDLEGTYLVWLDFRELGLTPDELDDLIINKAKLWLDSGKIFGESGNGFQRINVATSRTTLTKCLEQLRDAVSSLD